MANPSPLLEQLLEPFEAIARDPLATARKWKEAHGGRVVACVGLHVPEEIISAAGMLPFLLLDRKGPVPHADARVQNYMCGYIRSVVDQALGGDLDFVDSLVVLDSCHVIRMLGDALRRADRRPPRIDFLSFPVSLQGKEWQGFLQRELAGFVRRVEEIAGRAVTDDDLCAAIRRHNVNRRLLERLYAFRRARPGALSAVQVAHVVAASMCMPKDHHSALLIPLLEHLEAGEQPTVDHRVPVIVSGSLCETCDDVLQSLEAAGAVVVDDDLFVGSRYFSTIVDEAGAPLQALGAAYAATSSPCPTVYAPGRRLGEHLSAVVRDADAAGVVSVIVKYCEPHYYAYLMLRRHLRDEAIPEYMIEKERDAASEGQIKTRLEAFLETLPTSETR